MLYEYALSARQEDFYNITPQLRDPTGKSDNEYRVIKIIEDKLPELKQKDF